MGPRFTRLYSLEFDENYPEPLEWPMFASSFRLPPPVRIAKYAYGALNHESLVLLNWHSSFNREDVKQLLETGAGVFAITVMRPDPIKLIEPTALAVFEHVPNGLLDYCPVGSFNSPDGNWNKMADELNVPKRLERILYGERPYNAMTLFRPRSNDIVQPRSVFLATPFLSHIYGPFVHGAEAAMKALGIEVLNPGNDEHNITLTERVADLIDRSDFMIANLRYERQGYKRHRNANVYFEIGYAFNAKKPIWCFGYAPDEPELPSDLRGAKHSVYIDANHLALQLFYGLEGSSKRGTTAAVKR